MFEWFAARLEHRPECDLCGVAAGDGRLLDHIASFRHSDDEATPVWGRDELGAGEMWNSNSVMSWVLTRAGLDVDQIQPPPHGRAPGWKAGTTIARSPHVG